MIDLNRYSLLLPVWKELEVPLQYGINKVNIPGLEFRDPTIIRDSLNDDAYKFQRLRSKGTNMLMDSHRFSSSAEHRFLTDAIAIFIET